MKRLYVLFFLILLSLPILSFIVGLGPPPIYIGENRHLAVKPSLHELSAKRIEAYFTENLPFRTQFASTYISIWENWLSAWVRRNIKGENGHFFPNWTTAPVMDCYLGLRPLSKMQLYNIRTNLLGKQAYWQHKGAQYLCAFVPDKASLYPEYLPSWIKYKSSWSDQIQPMLKSSELNYLDFTPVLKNNTESGTLYNKRYDITHWNGEALSIAYEELVKKLNLSPSEVQPFTKIQKYKKPILLPGENVPWMKLNHNNLDLEPHQYGTDKSMRWASIDMVSNSKSINSETLLMLMDSYVKHTHQDSFSKSHGCVFPLAHNAKLSIHAHYRTDFKTLSQIAEKEQPDKVVEIFAERASMNIAQQQPPVHLQIAGELLAGDAHYLLQPIVHNVEHLTLSPLQANRDGRFVFMAKISSSKETYCQLSYSEGQTMSNQPQIITRKLHIGVNYIYIPLFVSPYSIIHLQFILPTDNNDTYQIMAISSIEKLIEENETNGI